MFVKYEVLACPGFDEKRCVKTIPVAVITVCIRGFNCCQTSFEVSKCVYFASIDVKIEHTVAEQNQDYIFQNAYLMFMPAETWAITKVNIAKQTCFCLSKLVGITEKLNCVPNSVVFVV